MKLTTSAKSKLGSFFLASMFVAIVGITVLSAWLLWPVGQSYWATRATTESIDGVTGSSVLTFTVSWSEPCRAMLQVLEDLEQNGYPVDVIDATKNRAQMTKWKVSAVPTIIILDKGRERQRLVGVQSPEAVRRALDKVAVSDSEAQLQATMGR